MSSTDCSNAIELLGNAGFELCDSFAQLGDDEMLAGIREKISNLKDRGLYDYQIEGVEWLLGNEFGILADDMQSKTLQLFMAMLISMELGLCEGCRWSVRPHWSITGMQRSSIGFQSLRWKSSRARRNANANQRKLILSHLPRVKL